MAISLNIHPVVIVFLIQTVLTAGSSAIVYTVMGPLYALSVMVGGGVAIMPQSLFGFLVFRQRGARNARAIARNLFVGEGLKLGITAALFAIVWLNAESLRAAAVFAGFVITVLAGQLSLPLILKGR
ncbi:MAG: ATP synthase subunit I [Pseudomonadota bacterium]|nr:ATP synthase subunit I [Pseudomonadota bacterium]